MIAAAAVGFTASQALKVGVISDMHTNLDYDSWASLDDNCAAWSSTKEGSQAPLGRIGCDPSLTLVDYMCQRFNEVFGDVDVVLVPGDLIEHSIAPHIKDAKLPQDWQTFQKYIKATTDLLKSHFPSTPVIMTIGNNDGYHSQAVVESEKSTFYSFLMNEWFTTFPGNAKLAPAAEETFMAGGYYRADISDSLSILTFNFEYMDNDDVASYHGNEASEQLAWLESQLGAAKSSGRKFILNGHVYAGTRYHGG